MKRTIASSPRATKGRRRPVVLLRSGALDRLFGSTGLTSYEARAKELRISVGALHSANQGLPVGAGVVSAVRLRFPEVPYEQSFEEAVVISAAA